ncbi:pck [Drosophila busckii]|uniref:Pck n=1 Tax=Drosophila busckii TaxID=30019 RepID=A0A0M4EX65_DROBS|nr:pck [Drosophila busckii]
MRNLGKQQSQDTTDTAVEKGDYPRATNGVVFGAIITFASFFVLMMSFCSPYWIESYEETRSNFKNMGIWQYCFKDYVHPNQFHKKFTGCHNVFSHYYYVIRAFLLPGWLMAVQAFVTMAFIIVFFVLAVLSMTIIRLPLKPVLQYEWLLVRLSYIGTGIALFMFLAVCIFGGCAYRRDWLMYPKFNVLGWSYALAVVSFMLLGLAALILHRESRQAYEARGEQKNLVMQMEMQEPGYQAPRHHHSQSRSLQGYI